MLILLESFTLHEYLIFPTSWKVSYKGSEVLVHHVQSDLYAGAIVYIVKTIHFEGERKNKLEQFIKYILKLNYVKMLSKNNISQRSLREKGENHCMRKTELWGHQHRETPRKTESSAEEFCYQPSFHQGFYPCSELRTKLLSGHKYTRTSWCDLYQLKKKMPTI